MNYKSSLQHSLRRSPQQSFRQLTGYTLTLMIGLLGVAATPEMASARAREPLVMAQSSPISGSWRLVTIGDPASPGVVPKSTELTAEFSDGRIFGSGGCNRFNGGYQTQGNQLTIGPLASTFKACEETVLNQETRYLNALQGAQRYEIDDQGQLAIFYQTEQETGVLRFTSTSVQGLW